jgi:glucosamine-6-phosphate deaminase
MQIIIAEDYAALSQAAAAQIAMTAVVNPTAAVVVATGNTPVGTYKALAVMQGEGKFDPSGWKVFQLDEYLGLAKDDKRTLWGWMERMFVDPLGLDAARITRLPCDTADADASCKAYDAAVAQAGGFDLAILGLGPNGHLAFNEPPADEHAPTRALTLSEESLASNSAYWGGRDQVPLRAMTAGMAPLLAAKRVVLLVSGKGKHDIFKRVTQGSVTADVPASFLQRHPNVLVICDRDAAYGDNAKAAEQEDAP